MSAPIDASLQPVTKALNQWTARLKQHYESYAEQESSEDSSTYRDGLVAAEILLYLDTFRNLMALIRERLAGKPGLDHPLVHRLIEDKFLFEKLAGLESKCRGSHERLLNKLKQAEANEAVVETKRLRARPEMFVLNDQRVDSKVEAGRDNIYKAPKTFAVPYAKDKKDKDEDEVDEDALAKEQERLRRSEFVRAITEDLLPTPVEVGNGEDELDARSRRLLKKFNAREEHEEENMTRLKRRKADEKTYMAVKEKQRQLTVGTMLSDLTSFVDRIGVTEEGGAGRRKRKPSAGQQIKRKKAKILE